MEKISSSLFNKFQENKITNLKMIRGGECTGGGCSLQMTVTIGGVTSDVWNSWTSDDTNGTYTNYTCTWHPRKREE